MNLFRVCTIVEGGDPAASQYHAVRARSAREACAFALLDHPEAYMATYRRLGDPAPHSGSFLRSQVHWEVRDEAHVRTLTALRDGRTEWLRLLDRDEWHDQRGDHVQAGAFWSAAERARKVLWRKRQAVGVAP